MSSGSERSKKVAKRRAKQSAIVVRVDMTALARLDKIVQNSMSRAQAIRIILEYAGNNRPFVVNTIAEYMRKAK